MPKSQLGSSRWISCCLWPKLHTRTAGNVLPRNVFERHVLGLITCHC